MTCSAFLLDLLRRDEEKQRGLATTTRRPRTAQHVTKVYQPSLTHARLDDPLPPELPRKPLLLLVRIFVRLLLSLFLVRLLVVALGHLVVPSRVSERDESVVDEDGALDALRAQLDDLGRRVVEVFQVAVGCFEL